MWPAPPTVQKSLRKCAGCAQTEGDMWWVPRKHHGKLEIRRLCDECAPTRLTRAL